MAQQSFCKAGGFGGNHRNYDLPHVCGFVYIKDGVVVIAKNCVFCGRDCSEEFEQGLYANSKGNI